MTNKEIVNKAREIFPYDGNKMFLRNENFDEIFYIHSSWLIKTFNKDKLKNLNIGEHIYNTNKTKITRIY